MAKSKGSKKLSEKTTAFKFSELEPGDCQLVTYDLADGAMIAAEHEFGKDNFKTHKTVKGLLFRRLKGNP